jgi:hypothetical protein
MERSRGTVSTASRLHIDKVEAAGVKDARDGFDFYGIPIADDGTFDVREALIILAGSGVGKTVQRLANE